MDPLLQESKVTVLLGKQARLAHAALIRSFKDNQSRMQYHRYLAQGLMIASGARESAPRNVLPERLKRFGHRWSIKECQ